MAAIDVILNEIHWPDTLSHRQECLTLIHQRSRLLLSSILRQIDLQASPKTFRYR